MVDRKGRDEVIGKLPWLTKTRPAMANTSLKTGRVLSTLRGIFRSFVLLGASVAPMGAAQAAEIRPTTRAHANGWEITAAASFPRFPWEPRDSTYCLGCHDGVIAPPVGGFLPSTEAALRDFKSRLGSFGGRDHPVGIEYTRVQQARPREFTHPASLPPAVKLVNGRVECTTCHDPTSSLRAMLVMDNRGSRLCLTCHQM